MISPFRFLTARLFLLGLVGLSLLSECAVAAPPTRFTVTVKGQGPDVLLIPGLPLVYVSVLSQVVNGMVLPFVLIFMLLLTNDRELMGEHVNSRAFNIVAWVTVVVTVTLTAAMILTQR